MPDPVTFCILALILALAYAVETCLGFGSNVIALAIGLFFVPLEVLLPVLVVLGVLQSSWNMMRSHSKIQWRLLWLNILPVALPGIALGILLRDRGSEAFLVGLLGLFIVTLSALELLALRHPDEEKKPLRFSVAVASILTGGIFQGLFASGGPPIVYYAGRKIDDPAEFRSTLATLWQMLNVPLLCSIWSAGQLGLPTLKLSVAVLPCFLIGATIGTVLDLKARSFKVATWFMLLFIGIAQIGRTVFGALL